MNKWGKEHLEKRKYFVLRINFVRYSGKWRGEAVAVKVTPINTNTALTKSLASSSKKKISLNSVEMDSPSSPADQTMSDLETQFSEILTLRRLQHPNILGFRCVAFKNNSIMVVTEAMNRGSMNRLLFRAKDKLDFDQKVIVLLDVARGLHHLHSKGIVHGMKYMFVICRCTHGYWCTHYT